MGGNSGRSTDPSKTPAEKGFRNAYIQKYAPKATAMQYVLKRGEEASRSLTVHERRGVIRKLYPQIPFEEAS
jgi:hypothetical protein